MKATEKFAETHTETRTEIFSLKIKSVTLEGEKLRLEYLEQHHVDELLPLIDPQIWKWYTTQITNEADFRHFIGNILEEQKTNRTLAFAIREKSSNQLIGSSRFLNIDVPNRRAEIGSTWYAPKWQRTFANTEAKFPMLQHAFETLSCISVHFQTDSLNERSRTAIERLGAKLDGVIRNQRICDTGRIRHSATYSITNDEWPNIKLHLMQLKDTK